MEVLVGNGYRLIMNFDEAIELLKDLALVVRDGYANKNISFLLAYNVNQEPGTVYTGTLGLLEIEVLGLQA